MSRRLGKGLVLSGATEYSGLTLEQIGAKAGGTDYTVVAKAIKRFEEREKKRRGWRDAKSKRRVAQIMSADSSPPIGSSE